MEPQGKYRIAAFKEFVPDWLRFTIILLGVLIFQFSNNIYLTNLNDIVGGKALTTEDVKLLSAAAFIGMTMVFPILFRIKHRFTSRTILLSTAAIVILGNVVCMYSGNLMVLLVTSLIVGAARMIGTFECFSTMLLKITPTWDFTVFFSFLYFIVLASIQLSGLLTAEISYLFNWQYMHILIVGLYILFMIVIYCLTRPVRTLEWKPLKQIDWLGMTLWTLVLVLINFIFEYGKQLDWLDSKYIQIAIVATIILFAGALLRMFTARNPFIMPEVFKYKNIWIALGLLILLHIFLSMSSVIMNAFTGGILHYDILNNTSLNWMVFIGIVIGTAFTYYWKSVYKGSYTAIFFVGFLALVLYHFILYFIFQPGIAKEDLYLPYVLRGFGHITLYISIALYATNGVIFPHLFAGLGVIGFARSAIGGTMANSLCTNVLNFLQNKNLMLLSQKMDMVDPTTNYVFQNTMNQSLSSGMSIEQAEIAATNALYGATNMQAMMLSWKEIAGGITLFGIVVLLVILAIRYIRPILSLIKNRKKKPDLHVTLT